MRIRQIDLLARTIRLDPGTTKNRDGREVTMTQAVHPLLKACLHGSARTIACSLVQTERRPSFRKVWLKATKAAGSVRIAVPLLRRTAARNLRRAGVAEVSS